MHEKRPELCSVCCKKDHSVWTIGTGHRSGLVVGLLSVVQPVRIPPVGGSESLETRQSTKRRVGLVEIEFCRLYQPNSTVGAYCIAARHPLDFVTTRATVVFM